jgi:hypothetical protein
MESSLSLRDRLLFYPFLLPLVICTPLLVYSTLTRRSTEYTEWQWPLSGIHSIMMENVSQAGMVGGCTPPPFTISTITHNVVEYAPAERADTPPPYFYSTLVCTLWAEATVWLMFCPYIGLCFHMSTVKHRIHAFRLIMDWKYSIIGKVSFC